MARTLVVLSTRVGSVLPLSALPALRAAAEVYADDTASALILETTGAKRLTDVTSWPADSVLLTTARDEATVTALAESADDVLIVPELPGAMVPHAALVMDRLRSEGGCPWDAEQTHTSLLQYLIEETYELHDAIEQADRDAMREELGDVLLQVLFHSRMAEEGYVAPFRRGTEPFSLDDVAESLIQKLVSRHPHVFAPGWEQEYQAVKEKPRQEKPRVTVADLSRQMKERRAAAQRQEGHWDQLKQQEKQRESAMDGVAMGQPAAALAAKVVSRAYKAGIPQDLIEGSRPYESLWEAVVEMKLGGDDPEQDLRTSARQFVAEVRAAEKAAKAAGRASHTLTSDDWRRFWPDPDQLS